MRSCCLDRRPRTSGKAYGELNHCTLVLYCTDIHLFLAKNRKWNNQQSRKELKFLYVRFEYKTISEGNLVPEIFGK